jgi:hypothetical protein
MTRLLDPETSAIASLLRVLADPAAAKAALEDHLCRLASIHCKSAELEMAERQLAERERQIAAREANIRRRESALEARK